MDCVRRQRPENLLFPCFVSVVCTHPYLSAWRSRRRACAGGFRQFWRALHAFPFFAQRLPRLVSE
eukprot:scaffold645_cov247-Pinguiococcus_pyrenoidosus.AAC.25